MAKIKTAEEIVRLRESGKRLGRILQTLKKAIKPGVSTKDLDVLAEKLIREGGDEPPFLNYTPYGARMAYPASLCVSINDEIVHGIPSESPGGEDVGGQRKKNTPQTHTPRGGESPEKPLF